MKRTARIACAIGVAARTAGASPTPAAADERPDINIAVNKLPRTLDPGSHSGNVDVRVYYSIYDTLLRRDFRNPPKVGVKLLPGLAESWSRPNPSTVELKLREGVTCHDGSPFNADDVVFTFSLERQSGDDSFFPRGRVFFNHIEEIRKLDDYTVQIITKEPDPIFEQRLSSYQSFVVCDEPWYAFRTEGEDYKVWMDKAYKALRWNPVGTGPYKFESYRKNDHVKLASNDSYWGGKPAAKSINFRAVPEVSARIAGIVSGEYQMIVEVPPDQWGVLDKYDDIKRKSVILDNSHILVFNTQTIESKKLRHALSLGIDRKKLIDTLWKGETYTPNGHQLASFGDTYLADRKGYEYDPEKARQLVKESGYDGSELSYRLIPGYYLNNVEAAQAIQEMWRQIGVNVKLDFVESFKKVRDKKVPPHIYAWSNTYRLPDPTGGINATWGPEAAIQTKYKYFQPPEEFNDLARELFSETDPAERARKFGRMLDIYEDERAMTILYNPVVTFAMNNNIDWTPYTLFFMDFRPDNFKIN
jgi:peptide/nickel transport system substrate-binding protein